MEESFDASPDLLKPFENSKRGLEKMNLYLTGYRGSGKSTVAPILAGLLGWEALDSDAEIETLVGQTIAEIFAAEGEKGFRRWEASVIEGLAMLDRTVISLGGGAVLDPRSRERLGKTGKTVWLSVSAETSWARIAEDGVSTTQRPNLTQTGGIAEIEQMLAERTPIYESCADLIVEADHASPEEIATTIFDYFEPILLHEG